MSGILRKICPEFIHTIYANTKFWLRFHFAPKGIANELHRSLVGYDINWKSPQTINEKINWMKFNYDTSVWTRLADKYLVRQYVMDRIGEQVLPKVYAVWDDASKINLENLPEKFVIKTNHGCGTVLPIFNKHDCNVESIRQIAKSWMNLHFGYETIEPHYLKIKPLIYAEEFLENTSMESSSIIDYKVFCINGKAQCILICKDRIIGQHPHLAFYDLDWNLRLDMLASSYHEQCVGIKKPSCLTQLINYANNLATGHPQVRIDFYIVGDKIYFGEMTFTSQGGYMDYLSKEYSLELGSMINL